MFIYISFPYSQIFAWGGFKTDLVKILQPPHYLPLPSVLYIVNPLITFPTDRLTDSFVPTTLGSRPLQDIRYVRASAHRKRLWKVCIYHQ